MDLQAHIIMNFTKQQGTLKEIHVKQRGFFPGTPLFFPYPCKDRWPNPVSQPSHATFPGPFPSRENN